MQEKASGSREPVHFAMGMWWVTSFPLWTHEFHISTMLPLCPQQESLKYTPPILLLDLTWTQYQFCGALENASSVSVKAAGMCLSILFQ